VFDLLSQCLLSEDEFITTDNADANHCMLKCPSILSSQLGSGKRYMCV